MADSAVESSTPSEEERHLWIVFTNSEDGRDDELNEWYEQHHLQEILGVGGFLWGQRLELHPDQRPGQDPPPWKYLALYESVGDLPELHADLKAHSPNFVKTDALKKDSVAWVYSYLGPRVTKSE